MLIEMVEKVSLDVDCSTCHNWTKPPILHFLFFRVFIYLDLLLISLLTFERVNYSQFNKELSEKMKNKMKLKEGLETRRNEEMGDSF